MMSTLRQEHRRLRKKVLPPSEGDGDFPSKEKSQPISLVDHVKSGDVVQLDTASKGSGGGSSLPPPPGLDEPVERPPPGLEHLEGGKQVRFGAAEAPAAAADGSFEEEQGTLSISHVSASSISSPTSGLTTRSSTSVATELADADTALEGVHVSESEVDGAACEVAVWRIGRLSERLKGCMGRALVSSSFEAAGIKDCRLMVFPDGKEATKQLPRNRKQKDTYAKKVTEGPLDACLKLKIPDCPPPHVVEYSLRVGRVKKGPFSHNFMDCAVNGCDEFGVDWLHQVEADHSLTVAVEIRKTVA